MRCGDERRNLQPKHARSVPVSTGQGGRYDVNCKEPARLTSRQPGARPFDPARRDLRMNRPRCAGAIYKFKDNGNDARLKAAATKSTAKSRRG